MYNDVYNRNLNWLFRGNANRGSAPEDAMTDVHNDILEDEDFDTILSPDIDFSGTLNFEKPFLIRGKVSGEISASGMLVVDEEAVVNANINASKVIIRGQVKGDVTASEKVEVTVTGRLVGNVTAPEIFMETGCVFNGRCTMIEKDSTI
jgi:cytoskeletal protein CcmA (bactofilin family)